MTAFEITRGELAIFKSSDPTERGFCRNCGTPLTIHDVAFTAHHCLDRLARRAGEGRAEEQYGIEGRLSWFAKLAGLPGDKTTEADNPEFAQRIAASNHQHPDHDTASWPQQGR